MPSDVIVRFPRIPSRNGTITTAKRTGGGTTAGMARMSDGEDGRLSGRGTESEEGGRELSGRGTEMQGFSTSSRLSGSGMMSRGGSTDSAWRLEARMLLKVPPLARRRTVGPQCQTKRNPTLSSLVPS